jgi:hypothetical protein
MQQLPYKFLVVAITDQLTAMGSREFWVLSLEKTHNGLL